MENFDDNHLVYKYIENKIIMFTWLKIQLGCQRVFLGLFLANRTCFFNHPPRSCHLGVTLIFSSLCKVSLLHLNDFLFKVIGNFITNTLQLI